MDAAGRASAAGGYHLYERVVTGSELADDAARRQPGGLGPPLLVTEWLTRPKTAAFPTAAQAVDWLTERYHAHERRLHGTYGVSLADRAAAALAGLERGEVVVWGMWINAGAQLLSLAAVPVTPSSTPAARR